MGLLKAQTRVRVVGTAILLALAGTAARSAKLRAAEPEAPPEEMLKKTVRIVDAHGAPIAGATVVPWAIRSQHGHGVWSANGQIGSEPPNLTTDADGKATIPCPRFIDKDKEISPQALTCRVEHPDYAETVYNDVPVVGPERENVATITLRPGARVTVTAYAGDQVLAADDIYPLWSSPSHWSRELRSRLKINAEGWLELPRLPAGSELLRLVYLPDEGSAMFSGVRQLTLVDDEQYKVRLEMRKAARVEGRLDDAVPRPVKNGRIIAEVIRREEIADGWQSLAWRGAATIEEDGTFVLDAMPRGDLQVIALCDGFMATSGEPPEFANDNERRPISIFCRPQVFAVADGVNRFTLGMTPTADCLIRVRGPDGQPVAGAKCSFWPNVGWWGGGSQIYCEPFYGDLEALKHPDRQKDLFAWGRLFGAETDQDGLAMVRNLPPKESRFVVENETLQLAGVGRAEQGVDLTAGAQSDVTVNLQPKKK
jgi:hypothetical protein